MLTDQIQLSFHVVDLTCIFYLYQAVISIGTKFRVNAMFFGDTNACEQHLIKP